jgi:hypothetical protein
LTGLIRVARAGSEAVSESQAACEGRCVRLALTGGRPRPEEPLKAKPAVVRTRRAEEGVGYRISRLVRPVPGGGGSSRFEKFGVWVRARGWIGPRRGLVRPGPKEPTPRFVRLLQRDTPE